MFLRARTRRKDGKQHRCWSVVETLTGDGEATRQLALFPDDRDPLPTLGCPLFQSKDEPEAMNRVGLRAKGL